MEDQVHPLRRCLCGVAPKSPEDCDKFTVSDTAAGTHPHKMFTKHHTPSGCHPAGSTQGTALSPSPRGPLKVAPVPQSGLVAHPKCPRAEAAWCFRALPAQGGGSCWVGASENRKWLSLPEAGSGLSGSSHSLRAGVWAHGGISAPRPQ